MRPSAWSRWLFALWIAGHLLIAVAATREAVRCVGMPFAGFLVDPWARFSNIDAPSWSAERLGLRYPDHIVAVDNLPLPTAGRGGVPPSRALYARVADAAAAGRSAVVVEASSHRGNVRVRRPIVLLSSAAVGFFFGIYALTGLFLLVSGVVVQRLSGRRSAAAAFLAWTTCSHVLFTTFFDFHTTTRFVWIFPLSVTGFQAALVWLAFLFPSPPRWAGRASYCVVGAVTFALLALGSLLSLAPWLSWDPTAVEAPLSAGVGVCPLVLAVSMVVRWRRAGPEDRATLQTVVVGLAALPAVVGATWLGLESTGSTHFHVVAPFLLLAIPLSVGYALIRHDLLESSAILTRRLLALPIVVFSAILALLVWLALGASSVDVRTRVLPVALAAVAAMALVAGLLRLANRWLFPATSQFRPTIRQLTDQLVAPAAAPDVARAIELSIARWLPTRQVQLVTPDGLDGVIAMPAGARQRLALGERAWTDHGPRDRSLVVPMRSLGVLRGVVVIAPKRGTALFTEEDLALLETIASLGAIALHNAEILRQTEALRRVALDLSRDEKTIALGLLGAQIAHEIAHPLNYFRGFVEDVTRGALPPADDTETAREEIDRLERMLSSLRRLEPPPVQPACVLLSGAVRRALDLVRDDIAGAHARTRVEVPDDTDVVADRDLLLQLLTNLLRNAAQHVCANGELGVSAVPGNGGGTTVDIWNVGPPIPGDVLPHLFKPWFTTRKGGTGLGLNIAVDIVKRLGWRIDHQRIDERTVFRITIPPSDADAYPDRR